MNSIKAVQKLIQRDPDNAEVRVLSGLLAALESNSHIEIVKLYGLKLENFDLALKVLQEWRLARYYSGKGNRLDLATQASGLPVRSLSA